MKKINRKGYGLLALTIIICLGLATTTYLVLVDLQVSAAKPTGVAFFGRSAWPEHHHFDISKELGTGEDLNQTLYAKIKNYNESQTFLVQAEFFINPAFGNPTHYTIYTAIEPLGPGEYTVLTADFGPLSSDDAGTYYVSARCLWLDGETWIQSDLKEFKFTIVP